jgi:hypothetical protein
MRSLVRVKGGLLSLCGLLKAQGKEVFDKKRSEFKSQHMGLQVPSDMGAEIPPSTPDCPPIP